jgi:4-amino-4-deoxy-L-arabinose transferase-like glycosyltransferase
MRKVVNGNYPAMVVIQGFLTAKSFFYLLLAFAALILLANLGLPPLWGSEGRWAVVARTMLRSGDLFSPLIGIHYYWDKPLLSYWQILPVSYIHGDVSEFTARLPSVVWAMVMLFLTHRLAKMWFGERTALVSVGTLATSYAFVFWGRNAQVEMTNAAMILLCLWYFLKHKSDRKYTWVYVLGVMMALGANMKGLVLYAVPLFCIVLLSVLKREWSWIPSLRILVTASLLSMAVFLAVPAIASIHGSTWLPLRWFWYENVLRFFGAYDHKNPFYAYFIELFYFATPWSFMLPFAIIHSSKGIRGRLSQIPEVLVLFGAIFLFFTLSESRRSYYLLPVVPLGAILVANVLKEYVDGFLGRGMQGTLRVFGVLIGLALVALFPVSLVLPQIFHEIRDALWPLSVVLALLGVTMIASTMKRFVWGMVGSVAVVWLVYVVGVVPLIAKGPNLKTQIAEVNALGRPCGFLNMDDAKIIYYLDKPYQIFYEKAQALDWATRVDGVLITPKEFSDPSWGCVAKGDHWEAMVPRKRPLLKNNHQFQKMNRFHSGGAHAVLTPSDYLGEHVKCVKMASETASLNLIPLPDQCS